MGGGSHVAEGVERLGRHRLGGEAGAAVAPCWAEEKDSDVVVRAWRVALFQIEVDSGEKRLNKLGYKQELRREITLFKTLAITFSTMTIFTGITSLYGSILQYAGPASLVWGWVIVSFFTWFIGVVMSRISPSLQLVPSVSRQLILLARSGVSVACLLLTHSPIDECRRCLRLGYRMGRCCHRLCRGPVSERGGFGESDAALVPSLLQVTVLCTSNC